jgi:hypothetical protein
VAGMINLTSGRRGGSRYWLVIVLIAVGVHLFLLFSLKPRHFNVFRRSIDERVATSSRPASFPDAIIAITVDVEGEEPPPIEIEKPPEDQREEEVSEVETPHEGDVSSEDLMEILGESHAPLPSQPSTRFAVIPPRPIEITWPETKNLRHCLGMHVDVRIRVSDTGKILILEPADAALPDDCTAAALRAARRIVFLPGTVDGRPETMWTEIRIDFRRQSH